MAGQTSTRKTIYYGHGIADPAAAPAISAERITTVDPADLDAFLAGPGRDCVMTFDDGYADNMTTALPILEKYRKPATVFVTTGFIARTDPPMERVAAHAATGNASALACIARLEVEETDPWARYEALRIRLKAMDVATRGAHLQALMTACEVTATELTADYLTLDQLREFADHPLITIGAHTVRHPDLRHATDAELRAELVEARATLESWLARTIDTIAYPYGDTDERVRRATAAAGYRRGYLTEQPNWRSRVPLYRRLDLPRVDLSSGTRRMRKRERKARSVANAC